jgi:flagellar biosynthesis protein FlhB
MAEESDSNQEKTEDPSAKRIEEFRNRGEVASSKELTSVLVLAASLLTLTLSMVYIYETMAEYLEWLYRLDVDVAYTEKSFKTIVAKTVWTGLRAVAPVCLVALCVGVFSHLAQIGFLFAPEVLQFKPERINPLQGVKRLFSMRSIVEAFKGLCKFVFIMAIVYYSLKDDLNSFQGFFHLEFVQGFIHAKWVLAKLGFSIILGLSVIALGDFGYQKFTYRKKMMMTKEQAKKESKEQDGNPEVKQRIRSIQREMSQRRMINDIPEADVIVTNPTHISVALKYDKDGMVSPSVVAKGADHLAMKIREIANEHNVPIVENVPLARALYKTVKLGETVPRNLYKAVAEVLAFVYKLKKKKKALS